MRVLVTGANGFIGGHLLGQLRARGMSVVPTVRTESGLPGEVVTGDIAEFDHWLDSLSLVDVVVHLAGRAHVLKETIDDPLAEFRRCNVEGSVALARAAADAGVRRFVYLSSVGVHGDKSSRPFTELDECRPAQDYAVSKLETEQALGQLANAIDMELVIVRPPLVYGPEAPGNMARLLGLVARGMPLPLGSIKNRRSFVGISNLVDFIVTCIEHPAASNETFLVADDAPVSTSELVGRMSRGLHGRQIAFPFPVAVLRLAGFVAGKQGEIGRLAGNLEVNIDKARRVLGWEPPVAFGEELDRMIDSYRQTRQSCA